MSNCQCLTDVFGDVAANRDTRDISKTVLASNLPTARQEAEASFGGSNECFMADLGNRMMLLLEVSLRACTLALMSEHVKEYIQTVVELQGQEDDLADLTSLHSLNQREALLRCVLARLGPSWWSIAKSC